MQSAVAEEESGREEQCGCEQSRHGPDPWFSLWLSGGDGGLDAGDAGARDGPQGERQIGGRLKALLGPFLEATADDGGERRRQFPQLAVELRRLRVQNGVHGFDAGGSLERAAS